MLAPSVSTTIDALLTHVDRFGMGASQEQIDQLAGLARHYGVADAIVEVLVDDSAPAVLRERAFARAIADLRVIAPTLAPVAA